MPVEVLAALIALIGVIIGVIPTYIYMQSRVQAEIDKLKAEADKLRAETEEINAKLPRRKIPSNSNSNGPRIQIPGWKLKLSDISQKWPGWLILFLFFIVAILGYAGGLLSNNSGTISMASPTLLLSPSASASSVPTAAVTNIPTPLYRDPINAIATETQGALQRATAFSLATQDANATVTQQYVIAVQTAEAGLELTRIYEQAQGEVATKQALFAQETAQAVIAKQQTETAVALDSANKQVIDLATQVSNMPVSLVDVFNKDKNGWAPKTEKGYSVAIQDGVFHVNYSDLKYHPFPWTCDNCGPFERFSFQVDIKTPKGVPQVISGILFGAPDRIDKQRFIEAYALLMFSNGAITLGRYSAAGYDILKEWGHRQDLFTDDGEFHTLQIIVMDSYATVFVDGELVDDAFSLDHPGTGYVGFIIQTANIDVQYDNLKIIGLP